MKVWALGFQELKTDMAAASIQHGGQAVLLNTWANGIGVRNSITFQTVDISNKTLARA